jgi:hypothetical protein
MRLAIADLRKPPVSYLRLINRFVAEFPRSDCVHAGAQCLTVDVPSTGMVAVIRRSLDLYACRVFLESCPSNLSGTAILEVLRRGMRQRYRRTRVMV